jgi:hypothetical protein
MKRMLGARPLDVLNRGRVDQAAAARPLWRKLRREIDRAIVSPSG